MTSLGLLKALKISRDKFFRDALAWLSRRLCEISPFGIKRKSSLLVTTIREQSFNDIFQTLASLFVNVRFVRLHFVSASSSVRFRRWGCINLANCGYSFDGSLTLNADRSTIAEITQYGPSTSDFSFNCFLDLSEGWMFT